MPNADPSSSTLPPQPAVARRPAARVPRRRRGRFSRPLALASLPIGTAALAIQGAARRLAGEDPDTVRAALRRRNAERMRRILGDVKGGALKAGQLLSTVEALFPVDPEETWRDALTGLQEHNAALPFGEVEPVLATELGWGWRTRFQHLHHDAAAAASIGQVHRGVWHDGRRVAVKIQYPGVREALTSDLRVVGAASRLAALVAPGLALPPLVAELRERLAEELDYCHEARTQDAFARGYAADPDIVIPEVVAATPRVLVQDWLDGTPIAEIARTGTEAVRASAAALYQRFLVSGPERAGWLHTDPHPGNFRMLDDGRLGVMDFGSALELPGGMPRTFGRLLGALADGDLDTLEQRLQEAGLLRPGRRVEMAKLADAMAPFTEPARHATFHFSRDWLRRQFSRGNDPRDPDLATAMQLRMPAEHLFTHRVWLGMVGVLCQLEATVEVRPVLERWLPGFAAP